MVGHLPLRHRRRSRWPRSPTGKAKVCASAARACSPRVFLGFTQFCINFDAVYLAERHITSGRRRDRLRAAADSQQLARLGLPRPAPDAALRLELAGRGRRGLLLFVHELHEHAADRRADPVGIGLTLVGMLGASVANVNQARPEVRRYPAIRAARLVDGRWRVIDARSPSR